MLTIIRTHVSSHAFMELADNGQHLLSYTEAYKHHSYQLFRLTELYAFWRSMKHLYKGISLARSTSCSRHTTNSMSIFERAGRKPHSSSGSILLASQ